MEIIYYYTGICYNLYFCLKPHARVTIPYKRPIHLERNGQNCNSAVNPDLYKLCLKLFKLYRM